jgi:hypothetical protein
MISIDSATTNASTRTKPNQGRVWVHTLAILALLCLELLLHNNMSRVGSNEIDVLPLARQFAEPGWVPQDWYLNQAPGYRVLFQALFGWLPTAWGFLATSIVGRFICYSIFAYGLAQLGRRLGLPLVLVLLALMLYFHSGCDRFLLDQCPYNQGAIAGEWLIGALEAKAVAYSLLPLVLGLMLGGNYRAMAALLGLMTSFHVLVGGWAVLTVLGWLILNRSAYPKSTAYWGVTLLIYLAASGLAIPAVFQHLTAPPVTNLVTDPVTAPFAPSYLYVFLRLPHHLNPLAWSPERWIRPIVLLLLLSGSVLILRRRAASASSESTIQALRLAQFVGIALIPFGLGLLIAPFDQQGTWLQYYPFRFGDVMLPFGTCLLLACALMRSIPAQARRRFQWICVLVLSISLCLQGLDFYRQVVALQQFPSEVQEVDPAWKNFTRWIRRETPKEAIVISPPVDFFNFTWLTERATIAKFKLLPQNSSGILEWYERLSDLAGDAEPWTGATRTRDISDEIEEKLTAGYAQLTTEQVQALMQKYQADYFATRRQHRLDLPIAYRNSRYILYSKP